MIIDASDRLTVTAGTAAIVMQIDGFGPGATPVPAATSQGMLRVEITITADTGNAGPVTLPFAEPQISVDDANQSDFLTCVISPPVPGQCFPIGGLPSWIRPGFGEVEFDPLSPGQSVTGYFFWDPLEPLPHGIPLQDIHLWVDDGNSEVQIPAAGA